MCIYMYLFLQNARTMPNDYTLISESKMKRKILQIRYASIIIVKYMQALYVRKGSINYGTTDMTALRDFPVTRPGHVGFWEIFSISTRLFLKLLQLTLTGPLDIAFSCGTNTAEGWLNFYMASPVYAFTATSAACLGLRLHIRIVAHAGIIVIKIGAVEFLLNERDVLFEDAKVAVHSEDVVIPRTMLSFRRSVRLYRLGMNKYI